jgi:hypothetical protein
VGSEDRWLACDFLNPADTIAGIQRVYADQLRGVPKLSAVVCATGLDSTLNNEVSDFKLKDAVQVSVIAPIMALKYLLEFNIMDHLGRAVFLVDRRTSEPGRITLKIAKAGIVQMVREFAGTLPIGFDVGFVASRGVERVGALSSVTQEIFKILNSQLVPEDVVEV